MLTKFAAVAVICALASTAGATESLRFGVEAEYPPFEYKLPSGELAGIDIDIGNAVCAKLQIKCTWVETPFDAMISALISRKFDVINSAMWSTEQRRKQIDFTSVIYVTPARLLARADSHLLPTAESLKGKRVGVPVGDTSSDYAMVHWASHGVNVVSYPSQEAIWADLQAGRIDASIESQMTAQAGFLDKPEGKGFAFLGAPLVDPKVFGDGVALGLRKQDQALRTRLNRALAELKKDGTLDKITQRYFSTRIVAP